MIIDATCPECKTSYKRTEKQITAVIKRSGVWICKTCTNTRINKARQRKIGDTRIVKKTGYIEEKTDRGWVRQHRLVMERYIGRKLMETELVHHKDGNKANNSIDNLIIEEWGNHTIEHHTGAKRTGEALKNIRSSVEKRSTTKLTRELAASIRCRVSNGESQKSVADSIGVSKMTISRAVRGESWK